MASTTSAYLAYANQPLSYPLVDGRLFIRGSDAVYCYDQRKEKHQQEEK